MPSGQRYSKLDLSHAYQQIELDDNSKQFTVINTHKGLFRYSQLPFGISSASAIFQRVMETLFQDIPNVVVYLDDVLISGKTEEEHLITLELVLAKLQLAGLHLKREKCVFFQESVEYLGHKIHAQGLNPIQEKVTAIEEAPAPQNLSQLKAYLGLLTYYGRFLTNLSHVVFPLYRLLRKDTRWKWKLQEEKTFNESKKLLISAKVLTHFDPTKKLVMACDASPYGIGAVLSHQFYDGTERPIGYASRSLTPAEKTIRSWIEKD